MCEEMSCEMPQSIMAWSPSPSTAARIAPHRHRRALLHYRQPPQPAAAERVVGRQLHPEVRRLQQHREPRRARRGVRVAEGVDVEQLRGRRQRRAALVPKVAAISSNTLAVSSSPASSTEEVRDARPARKATRLRVARQRDACFDERRSARRQPLKEGARGER